MNSPIAAAASPPLIYALARMIGNTPLVAIAFSRNGRSGTVYAKCEHLNLTGSIKDRMALHILKRAYETGRLRAGDRIVEATSGNTGIAFAAIGRALGHPVTVFMPDWMSAERKSLILSFGGEVVPVSFEQGAFLGAIRLAEEMAEQNPRTFLPRQFSNQANADAHASATGPEIWMQAQEAGLVPNAFVAGVGTGGTVMGVGRFLRGKDRNVRIHPVEPAESPTLTTGCKVGSHRIQGISDEFIPPIVNLAELNHVIAIPDGDSILMAQKLARELGLGVGISSGCNFLAAVKVLEELGDSAIVTTVFADDNKKYLTTDLVRPEPERAGYLSREVRLTGIRVLPRHCGACVDGPRDAQRC